MRSTNQSHTSITSITSLVPVSAKSLAHPLDSWLNMQHELCRDQMQQTIKSTSSIVVVHTHAHIKDMHTHKSCDSMSLWVQRTFVRVNPSIDMPTYHQPIIIVINSLNEQPHHKVNHQSVNVSIDLLTNQSINHCCHQSMNQSMCIMISINQSFNVSINHMINQSSYTPTAHNDHILCINDTSMITKPFVHTRLCEYTSVWAKSITQYRSSQSSWSINVPFNHSMNECIKH